MILSLQTKKYRPIEVKILAQHDPTRKRWDLNLNPDLFDSEASALVCLMHMWTGDHASTCSDTYTHLCMNIHMHQYTCTLRGVHIQIHRHLSACVVPWGPELMKMHGEPMQSGHGWR